MPGRLEESKIQSGVFTIVTCSNLIALKRVDLIIEALANVKCETNIMWYHFGDGPLRQSLEMKAATHFKNNNRISWQFMGQVKNEVLLSFYRDKQIDLFINTSSTEGLPVSIMEAQAFGIPAIATDVGGVREIINSETGTLVPSDVSAIKLASLIENYVVMDSKSKYNLRVNSSHNARKSFDAKKNYKDFISQLNGILATFLTNEENRNEN
jgi:glycosyltransferase involved in cell wall biosynthesis